MTLVNRLLTASLLTFATLLPVQSAERDLIAEVKARTELEAQRVEKEFTDGRSAAYKMVRADGAKLTDAQEKLRELLKMVQDDTSLPASKREVYLVTLKADLDRVREIADRGTSTVTAKRLDPIAREVRDSNRVTSETSRTTTAKQSSDAARSLYDSRTKALADSRTEREKFNDRYSAVMRKVEESAMPEAGNVTFPKNWKELSAKRTAGTKMTDKERGIMKALSTSVETDFTKANFEDVMDYLRKALKVDIAVDRRALEEVGASYDTPVTLKTKASARVVLKSMLSNLNLTYVIKDEAITITSIERAKSMTTTRAYYLGDLLLFADPSVPVLFTQAAMLERATNLVARITQQVDPQSWRINNPDAVGTIVFDPLTMSIVVKQTAEIHFMLGLR